MIAVGKIVKTVGVKGECKVALLTDVPGRLEGLTDLRVGATEQASEPKVVESVRAHRENVIIKLKGTDSGTDAERLKGMFLYVPPEQALRPSSTSYFVHEIVGMQVVTEEGTTVGVVSDVVKLPGSDIWLVKADGREIMIPAVREFIRSVDLAQKKITIHVIEGLLDLK